MKALKSYASQLDVPDDIYMVAIKYILEGLAPEANFVPRSMHKNFIGQLSVMAMNGPQPSPKTGMSTEPAMSNPQNDALNQFPGGIKAWSEYISKNLKYPAVARENKIEGRVILSFVVDVDGGIQDIKVLKGIGGGADEEAVRVVAQSPKWRTVVKNGDPAKTAYTLPISFNLNSNTQNTSQNNVLIPTRSSNDDVKDFTEVAVLPEFTDGLAGWSKYLTANLKYPELARKENITGRVIMSFIVEKDGSLSEIKVLRGIGGGADEESVRVLKISPKWRPGLLEGRPVRVAYTMPIFFNLGAK